MNSRDTISEYQDASAFRELLAAARRGEVAALDELVSGYRDYLLLIANQDLPNEIQRKTAPSDVVQNSLMTAHDRFDQFRGETEQQWLGWLRQIVVNGIRNEKRRYRGTKKRSILAEVDPSEGSSAQDNLADRFLTPRTQAVQDEEAERVAAALEHLPDSYRQVIELRNWQNLSYEEIAERMGSSPDAIRKIWARAVLKLQNLLKEESTGDH